MLKKKMVISFLLAPRRSSLARTNVLQLRAREKDIWSGKAQQSIRTKRFVKGDDTGQQGSDHPEKDIEMISRRTTLLNILVLGSVLGARVPAFGEARRPSTIQKFDTDNDGTLDLNFLFGITSGGNYPATLANLPWQQFVSASDAVFPQIYWRARDRHEVCKLVRDGTPGTNFTADLPSWRAIAQGKPIIPMAGEISCIPNLAELTAFAERARAE